MAFMIMNYVNENPVSMNGTAFQLNTKEFTKYCNS